jgi:ferredoxin/nitrate reductase gamma subunit
MSHVVDVALLDNIRKFGSSGALDVNACFNCGNCTAVCPLAQESSGFPRRVIRMAQVGMREELLANEEIWSCYACGECTQTCPREADPAQFMAAARAYAISRYDMTGISRLMSSSLTGLTSVFFVLSAFFTMLLLSRRGDLNGNPLALFEFIPGEWVHKLGIVLFAVIGLSAAAGLASMVYRVVKQKRATEQPAFSLAGVLPSVAFAIYESLAHRRFRPCETDQEVRPAYLRPWFVHASIMGGFLAMLVATTLDYLFKPIGSMVPPWNPVRILGALGGVVCLYGISVAATRRLRGNEVPYNRSSSTDWFFLLLLAATVFTGLLTEIVVYLPNPTMFGYILFLLHIVLAMDLIVLMPLTKFAHVLYRPAALALHHWANSPSSQTVAVPEA